MSNVERKYFYSKGTERKGPYSLEELKAENLNRETLVWHADLDQWRPAGSLPELKDQFRLQPPSLEKKLAGSVDPTELERPPKSWLIESILVTILCCLPFGLIGLFHAARVESKFYSGDKLGAQSASNEAERWTKIGFFTGIGLAILSLGWYVIVMAWVFWAELINLI